MLIDTHSHISFKAYDSDRSEVIKRSQQESVICIDVGTDYQSSKNAVDLAEQNQGIFAAVGVHPTEEGFDKEKFKKLAESKKVVAIGEIGLDYYHKPESKEKQKKIFTEQLDLAKELNLPAIIHCRMAHEDVIKILSAQGGPASGGEKLSGVIHCFTGNLEEAQKYIDLGFYLGINGIIFKTDLDEVIKKIPLDKILIETDCPFLTPPKAGVERNEPVFVKYVAERIAELKNISLQEVAEATTHNAKTLFKL